MARIDELSFPRIKSLVLVVNLRARALALVCFLACAGCSTFETPATNAMTASIGIAISPGKSVDDAPLAPGIGYLRVTLDGAVALFALGFVDHDANGAIEVYYGPGREVLRLQNGRLLGIDGVAISWKSVSVSSNPGWSEKDPTINRRRDIAPGERYDLNDQITVVRSPPAPGHLSGLDPAALSWFDDVTDDLPRAHVALDGAGTPVYGEQCLDQVHCLTWQLWPPATGAGP